MKKCPLRHGLETPFLKGVLHFLKKAKKGIRNLQIKEGSQREGLGYKRMKLGDFHTLVATLILKRPFKVFQ